MFIRNMQKKYSFQKGILNIGQSALLFCKIQKKFIVSLFDYIDGKSLLCNVDVDGK